MSNRACSLGLVVASALLLAGLALPVTATRADSALLDVGIDRLPPDQLTTPELQRLQRLFGYRQLFLLSQPSPDGRWLFANIQTWDGQSTLGFYDARQRQFTPLAAPILNPVWLDDRHLAGIARADDGSWELQTLDRVSGALARTALPRVPDSATQVSLAPGGRWLTWIGLPPAPDAAADAETAPQRAPNILRLPRARLAADASQTLNPDARDDQSATLEVAGEQLVLQALDLDDGTVRALQALPPGTELVTPAWSEDGQHCALAINRFNLRPELESDNRGQDSLVAAFNRQALGQIPLDENDWFRNNRLLVIDLTTPTATIQDASARTRFADSGAIFRNTIRFSPDGHQLLVELAQPLRFAGRPHPAYFTDSDARSWQVLTSAELQPRATLDDARLATPGSVTDYAWLSENELLFDTLVGFDTQILRVTLSGSEPRVGSLTGLPDGYFPRFVLRRGAGELLFQRGSLEAPYELWRYDLDQRQARIAVELNQGLAEVANVRVHRLSVTLSDGSRRPALWVAPTSMAWPPVRQPLVVWQNGGPGDAMANAWNLSVETPTVLLPAFGLGVLILPLEQRPGWGIENWSRLADGANFGQVDVDAAAEVVKQLAADGYLDRARVGISGCSYGGYFAFQSIARHPGLYAAANPQCSLLDLITEFQTGYVGRIAYLMGATPWDAVAEYTLDSPAFQADAIVTPTLIFHGTKDFLPISITLNLFQTLAENGTEVRMLRLLDVGHGINPPLKFLNWYAFQEQLLWFRRYLTPE